MNISNIINWLKLSPKYIIPIALLASLLLFLPADMLSTFGVNSLVDRYRMWIGLICLGSYALLLSHFAFWLKPIITRKHNTKRFLKTGRASLQNLSPEETLVLSDFLLFKTKSQKLDIQDGVTNGLEQSQIIYRSANLGSLLDGFAYNIQPWAWNELNANPDLLEPVLSQRRKALKKRTLRY